MGCLGTQTGRKEDNNNNNKKKGGKREKKENKQTNEQWGSQDRDATTGKTASRGEDEGGLTDTARMRDCVVCPINHAYVTAQPKETTQVAIQSEARN